MKYSTFKFAIISALVATIALSSTADARIHPRNEYDLPLPPTPFVPPVVPVIPDVKVPWEPFPLDKDLPPLTLPPMPMPMPDMLCIEQARGEREKCWENNISEQPDEYDVISECNDRYYEALDRCRPAR